MSANGISTLTIPTGITATSYTQASSYLVAVGTFNYDAYGPGFAIRKDGGAIDAYMAQVIALGAGTRNWTFVPANGQPSFTRSMTQPDGTNTSNDPSESGVAIWNVTTAAGNLSGTGDGQINISLIPNGTSFVIYATELGGGGGADKEARQLAKLNIAQAKRQGKTVARDGTISGSLDSTKTYYRSRNTYDITQLPDTYNDSIRGADDNPNTGGLIEGRPWISAPAYTIVTSGLRLYLDAGNSSSYNGSGTSWTDLSSNTNDATLVGSPAFTSAGTSSYFTFPNDTNKYATTPYTKYSGTYTGKTTFFVARMDAGIADGYHGIFGYNPGRTFNTYIYKQAGPVYQIHASFDPDYGWSDNLTLTTGQWFTFGATQAANGDFTYYFNGQAVGVTTGKTFTNTYSSSTNPQIIGKIDNLWHGDVAVVTVYDRALSGAEMTQNHNAIQGRYGL
jgi:hypothetical protein